jgi:transcriptional regulator with XRE-family HTH domain
MDASNLSQSEISIALKGFFNIASQWGLSTEQGLTLLGVSDKSALDAWQEGTAPAPSDDTLERISYVFGIYRALRILFPTTERASEWPAKPNSFFEGKSALEVMLDGRLSEVRRYLDSEIQCGYL